MKLFNIYFNFYLGITPGSALRSFPIVLMQATMWHQESNPKLTKHALSPLTYYFNSIKCCERQKNNMH